MISEISGHESIDLCVLLYSGGLDTSCMLKWIKETYSCDVITVAVNLGQLTKDFRQIERKALKTGAKKHYTVDAREEFVKDYIFPALKANALYEGSYPLSSAIARPLIAKYGVKIALKEKADAIAHGCTGKGNDQVRFSSTIRALAPQLKIIQPAIEWGLNREEEIKFAKEHGIPIPVDVNSPYSIDENLWGRSIECGILEHEDIEPPEEVFKWTTSPEKAPDKPEYVEIKFEKGVPIAL
ncbi:argininosuccinate synthase, partial [Candidatus Geothermarchaeota archaeon]